MKTLPETLIVPPRTLAHAGAIEKLLLEAETLGQNGLLVHGRSFSNSGGLDRILHSSPRELNLRTWCHPGGEPTLAQLGSLLDVARASEIDWVAAVGGGSVMDIAKACAGLLEAPEFPVFYHDGGEIPPSRIPFIAVPSTAGTGSEATVVAVLTNEGTGIKKSIRHPTFMARIVILDPDLLIACPPSVLASSGMDAFTQALESYVSTGATWFTDVLALKALQLIDRSLPGVYAGTGENDDRFNILQGSYLAGLALSHARLGLVHGLAHPLGTRYGLAHGTICAICLPCVVEFNRSVMGEKYDVASRALGTDLLDRIHLLMNSLQIASSLQGQAINDMEGIVAETLESGSTKANPRRVAASDVRSVVTQIFARP